MPPERPTLSEKELKLLIDQYREAERRILATFDDATDFGQARRAEQLLQINKILIELGEDTGDWLDTIIPSQYKRGTTDALAQLGSINAGIKDGTTMSAIDRRAVAALTSESQAAFASSLTVVGESAGRAISDAVKEAIRFELAEGRILGSTRKEINAAIKKALQRDGITALTDRRGVEWSLERYADMLGRTKMVEARNAGMANKMVANGYDLVEVSDHQSAHRACAAYEGKILSLTGKTPGYTTLDAAMGNGLLHPNCKHQINVIRTKYADMTTAYDSRSQTYKPPFIANKPKPPVKNLTPIKPKPIAAPSSAPVYAGVTKGKAMTPEQAVKANPNYALGGVWRVNCQRTVPTYELRRRGYDVVAKPYNGNEYRFDITKGIPAVWGKDKMDYSSWIVTKTREDGSTYLLRKNTVKSEVQKAILAYPVGARIQMTYGYVGRRSGHTTVIERVEKSEKYPGGLMFIDPQPMTISNSFNFKGKTKFDLIRMDNTEIDPTLAGYTSQKRGT